jgi:hypothetical protein
MQAFLEASYFAQWHEQRKRDPDRTDFAIAEEREVGTYIQRAQLYWANVLFESVHLCGILCLLWLPILSTRLRRFMPILWGTIPFLILTPYYLGYCEIAFTTLSPWHGGGVLYPWIVKIGFRPLTPLTPKWDFALLNALPHPLSAFTQWPLDVVIMSGGGTVGPTVAAIVGLCVAVILWACPRLSQRVLANTRAATAQPSVPGDAEDRSPHA